MNITTPPGDSLRGAMFTMRVQGAKGCSWHPLWIANVNPGSPVPLKDGSGVKVRALIWAEEVAYGIQIPKTASADAAIEVTFEKKPGFAPVRIPLKTVLEKGVFAATPCADLPLRIDARRMDGADRLHLEWGNRHRRACARVPFPCHLRIGTSLEIASNHA